MSDKAPRLPFVQLELAGTVGVEEGRYLARDPERVLVVRTAGAPAPPRRRLRKAKPKDASTATPLVPLTTLTAIRPEPLGDLEQAESWLERMREDSDAVEAEVADAVALLNRAVHAHRAAALDPGLADVSADHALAVRVGFGDGEGLADGRWDEAIELPGAERQARIEALAPQEKVAGVLGRRESVEPCTMLLLRARADLDLGRGREAALQLRVGLESMLADRSAFAADRQAADLAALDERRRITGEAANEALTGELRTERTAELTETLELCERVLRRHRAHG